MFLIETLKMSVKKSLAFLYTNNEKTEREIKESIQFTIAKKILKKYLGKNIPKEAEYITRNAGLE